VEAVMDSFILRNVFETSGGDIESKVRAKVAARSFLIINGIDLVCRPAFQDLEIDGLERTSIKLILDSRQLC
jgi:stage V sporulation protein S